MAKQIILYNLAPNVTDDEYKEYVASEKGPLLESFESIKKFEVVKIDGAMTGESPYKYVGILHTTSLDDFNQKDAPSQRFQEFFTKWVPMVSDFHILFGEEIY